MIQRLRAPGGIVRDIDHGSGPVGRASRGTGSIMALPLGQAIPLTSGSLGIRSESAEQKARRAEYDRERKTAWQREKRRKAHGG
jgi:hypothetical protein